MINSIEESGFLNVTNYEYVAGTYYSTENYSIQLKNVYPNANSSDLEGHLASGVIISISNKISIIPDISVNKGFANIGNNTKDCSNPGSWYYYGTNKNLQSPLFSNYGTNFSAMGSVRLNIKLGGGGK